MPDTFKNYPNSLLSPPRNAYAVTPADGSDLPYSSRALNVGTAGAVRLTMEGGEDVTVFIAAGVPFPIRARRIWASGTTAENIVVLY